jgi:uncharacterized protein YxjI
MVENNRYKIHQRLISIGDDFWIETQAGQKVFKVDGKALRIRKTLILEDAHGNALCKIQERMLRIKDTMEIEDAHGKRIALVQKALIAPFRDRFTAKIRDGADLVIQGDLLDHEYTIKENHKRVAEISKKWFRFTDTYGVEVDAGHEDFIILTIAIVIDMMVHDTKD